jgi:CheY-like chemotaxis protein
MILAVLDDLMFTSKIRTTASQLGVTVVFARSRDGALTALRAARPAFVILDLNNPRIDPIGIVADMKADPTLTDIATVAFASHIQTAAIEEARAAGVTEVMARSAFTQRLPELLSRDK